MNGRQSAMVLGLLAALYAAALVLLAPRLEDFASDSVMMLFAGLLFASPPMLASWAIHSETRVVPRLLTTTWLFAAFFLAASYGQVRNFGHGDGGIVLIAAVGWITAYVAVLLSLRLLRAVRGWRLLRTVRDGELGATPDTTQPAAAGRHRQFTIRTLLVCTTAAAALCAGFRWLAPYGSFDPQEWPANMLAGVLIEGCAAGLLVALAGLPVLAVAWLLLADGRRPLWRAALIVVTAVGVFGGTALVGRYLDDENIATVALIRMIELGVLAAALVAVSVMRACGYRLVRASRAARRPADVLAPKAAARPRRQFALALAALSVLALLLAGYTPFRLETWRRADEVQRWIALGWHAELDEQGHVTGLAAIPGHDLGGSEAPLVELHDLRSLDFSDSGLTDIQLLQYPIRCPVMAQLESLNLTRTAVGDEAMVHLDRFANLKDLCLAGTKVTDKSMSHLSPLPGLQRLDISDTVVSLKQVPALPQLESLSLEGAAISDAELAQLVALPNLKTLKLARTNVTDVGLAMLTALRSLSILDLSITDVSDEAASSLSQLTQLRSLNLELTAVSEAGFLALSKALPDADINVGANDASLSRAVNSQILIKMGRMGIAMRRAPRSLKRLHARGNYPPGPVGNAVVSGGKTVTDAGLPALSGQTAMEELDLRDSGITDAGLPALTKLTSLKRLDLRGTAVTDAGRDTLAKALPGCAIMR